MSISNVSHIHGPSQRVHLNFSLHLASHVSARDVVLLLNMGLVVETKDVLLERVIFEPVVREHTVSASLIVVSSIVSKLDDIGFVFDALASAAEDLDEEEQSDPGCNEDPVVENEHQDVPLDVLDRDLHQSKLLPV